MKKIILIALLCVALSLSGAAQNPQGVAGSPSDRDRSIELRRETFDMVWRTVKEKHFDPTFGGVDWDKVRQSYAPRVAEARDDQEFYKLLQQMVGELHQSHFNIFPPGTLALEDSSEPASGGIGIDLQILDGLAVITRVEPESPAVRAGLGPGFVVKKVDQTSAEQIFERFRSSKGSPAEVRLRMARALLARIDGKAGTETRITYLDELDRVREVTIKRESFKGEMSPRFGNFPPQYTTFEFSRVAGGIGYIRFNVFVTSLIDKIRAAIRSVGDSSGLIIDLRGNPGGFGGMSSAVAGLLEAKQTSLGRMKMRAGYVDFAVFPQSDPYLGPLVVLIDGRSASTSEILAAGLQEIGRAVIVGERSAGAALPSVFQKLPTGAVFQYAIGDFKSPKGTLIEGRGVIPDVEVKLSRAELLKWKDAQLEAAVQQIQKRLTIKQSNNISLEF